MPLAFRIGYAALVTRITAPQFAVEAARIAQDHKCEDVVLLDLRGISMITDYVVICTGTSDRQMATVADRVTEYGRRVGEKPFGLSGYGGDSWIVLDFIDVVIHVFSRSSREYYDLELLWGDAPRLQWARSETA